MEGSVTEVFDMEVSELEKHLTSGKSPNDKSNDSSGGLKSQRNSSGSSSSPKTRSKNSPISFPKTKGSIISMASNTSVSHKRSIDLESSASQSTNEQTTEKTISHTPPVKRRKVDSSGEKLGAMCDPYCWSCHKEGTTLDCAVCPRSYHPRCTGQGAIQDPTCWMCPECQCIMVAEDIDTQSPAMSVLSVDQLVTLFKFSLQRLKSHALEAFQKPVCPEQVPTYSEYVVHPMDLQTLEKNIKQKMYGCTESLLADAKWIYHNSIIFNGNAHKLTSSAKSLLTACKQEMREIEVCPDCYLHAYTLKENWFVEPCRRPHVLVWAKLKGFPFWPGKAMRIVNGNVDVRFFGAHDRAWVPENLCYQLSSEMPAPVKTKKKTSFENSLDELEQHIAKLRLKLGWFEYAPVRTPFDPEKLYLSPVSKVSTGRRHSDVDQVSPSKGRTVTIVTSSWMRKIQAEGAVTVTAGTNKPSPTKKRKRQRQSKNATPKKEGRIQSDRAPATPRSEPVILKPKFETDPAVKAADANKNPPLGVFEISNVDLDIPKELNIQTQTLVLSDFSASQQEKLKKLESTIERIRETFNVDEEEDGQSPNGDGAAKESVQPESGKKMTPTPAETVSKAQNDSSDDDTPLSQLQEELCNREKDSGSPTCEVSSTTTCEPRSTSPSKKFETPKEGSSFVMKLHQTIQSCKANLGLDNVSAPDEIGRSDSEEESGSSNDDGEKNVGNANDEVATDKQNSVEVEVSDGEICLADGANEPLQPVKNAISSESDNTSKNKERMETSQLSEKGSDSDSDVEVIAISKKQDPVVETSTLEMEIDDQSSKEKQNSECSSDVVRNATNEDSRCSLTVSDSATDLPPSRDTHAPTTPPDITKYAYKVIEIMTDLCKNVATPESYEKVLEMEIGRINWLHEQEIREIKHNTDLVLLEVRACMEADKKRTVAEMKRKFENEKNKLLAEKDKAIAETKKKQWCANCGNEAIYYCCWNTSYCDYKCQQEHWPSHMASCAQTHRASVASDALTENVRPGSNVVITQIQSNPGRPQPRVDQNRLVAGDCVEMIYDSYSEKRQCYLGPISHTLPPPMLNPPHPSQMQCFAPLRPNRNAQVLPQTSGAPVGNNTSVSVHYLSSLPSTLSNYHLIPQNIPLPRITVPRLPQVSSAPPTSQPHLVRPPTIVVSRPTLVAAKQPRLPPPHRT